MHFECVSQKTPKNRAIRDIIPEFARFLMSVGWLACGNPRTHDESPEERRVDDKAFSVFEPKSQSHSKRASSILTDGLIRGSIPCLRQQASALKRVADAFARTRADQSRGFADQEDPAAAQCKW